MLSTVMGLVPYLWQNEREHSLGELGLKKGSILRGVGSQCIYVLYSKVSLVKHVEKSRESHDLILRTSGFPTDKYCKSCNPGATVPESPTEAPPLTKT